MKSTSVIACFQEYILKGVVNAALGQEMGSVSMKSLLIYSLQSYSVWKKKPTNVNVQPAASLQIGSSAVLISPYPPIRSHCKKNCVKDKKKREKSLMLRIVALFKKSPIFKQCRCLITTNHCTAPFLFSVTFFSTLYTSEL